MKDSVQAVRDKLAAARAIAEDAFNAPSESTVMALFARLYQEIELEGIDLEGEDDERVGTVH